MLPKPKEYAIYPGIGIARLGTSNPITAYVGPEFPNPDFVPPGVPGLRFRTPLGNIRRQIARFRVYRVKWRRYERGWIPRNAEEVTTADGFTLKWTVSVANCKSFNHTVTVDGRAVPPLEKVDRIPNEASKEVSGVNQPVVDLTGNATWPADSAKKADLLLGQIATDSKGRLLFAAGVGISRDVEGAGRPLDGLFHMGWFDDACDGSVDCEVVDPAGAVTTAERAWVVAGPPAYAPQIEHPVSLYDVSETIAIATKQWPRSNVSVSRHILPILRTTQRHKWVSVTALSGHHGELDPFDAEGILIKPGKPGALPVSEHRERRRLIFGRLKHPSVPRSAGRKLPWPPHWYPVKQGKVENVFHRALGAIEIGPQGDEMPLQVGLPFTREQWLRLRYWSTRDHTSGIWDFPDKVPPVPAQLEDLHPAVEQLDALNRAHLGAMVGGSTAPGIEVGWKALEPSSWGHAFRPSASLEPGDLTFTLSVPWPADFFRCTTHDVRNPSDPLNPVTNMWWPSARPLEIFRTPDPGDPDPSDNSWDRGVATPLDVDWWKTRGFIIEQGAQFEETEKRP